MTELNKLAGSRVNYRKRLHFLNFYKKNPNQRRKGVMIGKSQIDEAIRLDQESLFFLKKRHF